MKAQKTWWGLGVFLLVGMTLLAGQTMAIRPGRVHSPAAAGLGQHDDFLISRAVTAFRSYTAVAYNDDLDEYLVVWMDARSGDDDIYGQFVSSVGIPLRDNFVIRHESGHWLEHPDVAYETENERYLVVWEDSTEYDIEGIVLEDDGTPVKAMNVAEGDAVNTRTQPAVACYAHATDGICLVTYERMGTDYDIYSRQVTIAGDAVGSETAICTTSGNQLNSDLAVNPASGHFLIVWDDGRAAAERIYGRVEDHGGALGAEFVVSSSTSGIPRTDPSLAFSPDAGSLGEWLVVFERETSQGYQLSARRVTAAGAAAGDLLDICNDSGDQTEPDMAYNSNSNQYLVAWLDDRADGLTNDVYGRRVGADGAPVGNTFAINTAPGPQGGVAVAASPTAPGYLAAFPDVPSGDIYGQRLDVDGAMTGHPFAISTPILDQKQPAIAYNSEGQEYLVVWQDDRNGNTDIYGQRVDLDGNLLLTGGSHYNLAISVDAATQIIPDVAYNPDTNQYLVVWQDNRTGTPSIYGQRVDADGILDGGDFVVASTTVARRHPHITFNPISGEFLVVYTYSAENGNVRGRRVPASGNPASTEIDIATGAATQERPDVACRAKTGGGYLVVWRETDGGQEDVRGQRLGSSGSLQDTVLDICTEASSQWFPRLAYSPDSDHYLVVWPDDRDAATQGRNIYGRRVGGAGVLKGEVTISTAAEDQAHVAVTYANGLDSYIVIWDDDRPDGAPPDIYAQQISNDGVLVETTVSENDLIFEYSGWQQNPAIAWAGDNPSGLTAWHDGRNGDNFLVYGMRLGLASNTVFLPLVLKNH